MILVKNNQQLEAEEAAKLKADQEAKARQNRPVITSLVSYVRDCWEASKEAKRIIEQRMLDSLRRKNGVYDPTKLAEIKNQGGSEIFMMLTDEKCSAVSSWLSDILFQAGDKPWGIKPTPVPDINPQQITEIKQQILSEFNTDMKTELMMAMEAGEIQTEEQAKAFMLQNMQERLEELSNDIRTEMEKSAKEARDKIETKLYDVIIESGWEEAVKESLDDIATFPAGIVKGPVLRQKKKMKWKSNAPGQNQEQTDQGFQGKEQSPVEVVEEVSIDFNRVSPFDIYPLPNARTPEDGLIERHRLTRRYLTSLIGVKGYDDDAIRMVLQEYGNSGQSTWLSIANDQTRQELENRPNEWRSPETMIDALQFWGNVQGLKLLQYGMSPELIEDPFSDYAVEVWLIGNYVIKAEVNGDPMGRVPYNFASFRKQNGSIWGKGPPEVFKDSQDAVNAAARNLINNMGISSGPQVMLDVSQMPVGANITDMYPWKLWQVNSESAMGGGSAKPPLSFFMPPSVAGELIAVYKFFSEEADNKTGIPKYSYGGEAKGGALSTATGFSMMMGNASRGIKNVVGNIDFGIIKPSIERTHEFQLLFFRDPEYFVGDIKIIAKGSSSMIAKEQAAVRRNELLGIVSRSEQALSIIGEVGFASMLREIFKAADFKDTDIVPEKKEMLRRERQNKLAAQKQLQMEQQGGQLEKGKETDPAGNVAGGKDVTVV